MKGGKHHDYLPWMQVRQRTRVDGSRLEQLVLRIQLVRSQGLLMVVIVVEVAVVVVVALVIVVVEVAAEVVDYGEHAHHENVDHQSCGFRPTMESMG